MEKNEIIALLDFYLFSDLENEAEVDTYLEEEGVDFNSFYENMGMLIKKKKAELKLNEGRKFREEYLNRLKDMVKEAGAVFQKKEGLRLAFRNLENNGEDEMMKILEDKNKLDILKKILEDKGN